MATPASDLRNDKVGCYITPKSIDEDEFVDRFLSGEYDDFLDKELARNGWNE